MLIDAIEVARIVGHSLRFVRRLDASGMMPAGIRIRRSVRWRRAEIVAWVDAGCPTRAKWDALQSARRR
jgi:predicted DNA-binding transcriptional regulator AlpA